jgi:hypothetical protein
MKTPVFVFYVTINIYTWLSFERSKVVMFGYCGAVWKSE